MELNINDVKKGYQVIDNNGITYTVMDNAKGLRRMVRPAPGQGLYDEIGSMYSYEWKLARQSTDQPFSNVVMTDAQAKQAQKIKEENARYGM